MITVYSQTHVFHIFHRVPFSLIFFREMNVLFNDIDIIFLKDIILR